MRLKKSAFLTYVRKTEYSEVQNWLKAKMTGCLQFKN